MVSGPDQVVVVGASAGGVEALRAMTAGLPADLAAAVLVVLHMPASGTSALPAILTRTGSLSAAHARDGEPLRGGHIHVARPDHHLLVVDGTVALSRGPSENSHRPAIDTLFRSAAVAHGSAVTGVLLSGVLDDGVAGLHAIARRGGTVVVQDPDDALYPSMPEHALRVVKPDHVVAAAEIGTVLAKVTAAKASGAASDESDELVRWENDIAFGVTPPGGVEGMGIPSQFSCPDCGGVLADIDKGERYRCQVGHAWTAEALLAAQGSAFERALWMALRSLDEKAALFRRMAARARARGSERTAERYDQQVEETRDAAQVIRQQLGISG
jgi:two-component system chemotaxis response regulator CheB